MPAFVRNLAVSTALALTGLGLAPTSAQAGTITVNCPGDSLQAAIDAAGPGDTLWISGTCTGQLAVAKNVLLEGNPVATIDGNALGATLSVAADSVVTVNSIAITNGTGGTGDNGGLGGPGGIYNAGTLTLSNSTVSGNTGGAGGPGVLVNINGGLGGPGGIYNTGTLTLSNSTVSGNTGGAGGPGTIDEPHGAKGGLGGNGGPGGIYNTGTLTLSNSTVSGNTGNEGGLGGPGRCGGLLVPGGIGGNGGGGGSGGILNAGSLTVTNSTVSFNNGGLGGNGGPGGTGGPGGAGGEGGIGGIGGNGGIYNAGTLTLSHSTVSGNAGVGGGSGGTGGGAGVEAGSPGGAGANGSGGSGGIGGPLATGGSIIAKNQGATGVGDDVAGANVTSTGYNLVGSDPGITWSSGPLSSDQIGTSGSPIDPLVGPLANNGGPTATMALGIGSPALDKIPSGCPAVDQRGVSRPQGSACDIGAFELATPSGPATTSLSISAPAKVISGARFRVTGALSSADAACKAAQTVKLRKNGTIARTKATSAPGGYSFTTTITAKSRFQVIFAGTTKCAASVSVIKTVRVT